MGIISDAVSHTLHQHGADVYFISGKVTKWWNNRPDRNRSTDIALLSGWYWSIAGEEAGPFRTPSAARRDVYYRRILGITPPQMTRQEAEAAAAREQRKAQGAAKSASGRRGTTAAPATR